MGRIFHIHRYQSPCGPLLLGAMEGTLYLCDWAESPRCMPELRRMVASLGAVVEESDDPVTAMTREQLEEYFKGQRIRFDLPVATFGTEFQRAVRNSLTYIPYGKTLSYARVADAIGRPEAVRAAAAAIASNPLSIIVPCHRVVASDGGLGGYRGGLTAKRFLLTLEQRHNTDVLEYVYF